MFAHLGPWPGVLLDHPSVVQARARRRGIDQKENVGTLLLMSIPAAGPPCSASTLSVLVTCSLNAFSLSLLAIWGAAGEGRRGGGRGEYWGERKRRRKAAKGKSPA